MRSIHWLGVISILSLLLLTFSGCATLVGDIPTPADGVKQTRVDSVHGVLTTIYKDGRIEKKNFDTDNYLDVDWTVGHVFSTPKGFVWEPLAGGDYMATQGWSWFAGTKWLSIGPFGMHFGIDGTCLIPVGVNWHKGPFVFGAQMGVSFRELFKGNNPPFLPGGMLSVPFD